MIKYCSVCEKLRSEKFATGEVTLISRSPDQSSTLDFSIGTGHIAYQLLLAICSTAFCIAFETYNHFFGIYVAVYDLEQSFEWGFGIHGSVHSWFKSYLSSRSFHVKYDNNFSPFAYFLLCCSPRLCSRPSTFLDAHYSSQYSYSLPFRLTTSPPPLCRWHHDSFMTLSSSSSFAHSTLTFVQVEYVSVCSGNNY